MTRDFNDRILSETAHRPWPMPQRPWIMTQTWNDLLFAHWPLDPGLLVPKIPSAMQLDLFEGLAWIGIVPFRMTNVSVRGLPALPWISEFPELNVRTYVRVGSRSGVYFFSLDASSALAVKAARALFCLPYYTASMEVRVEGKGVQYTSRRTHRGARPAELRASYQPSGKVFRPEAGSLEYFLTERYCLYTLDRSSRLRTVDIHHPPWPLQDATAFFEVNTMADAAEIQLPDSTPVLHFAKRQDMVAWPLATV